MYMFLYVWGQGSYRCPSSCVHGGLGWYRCTHSHVYGGLGGIDVRVPVCIKVRDIVVRVPVCLEARG